MVVGSCGSLLSGLHISLLLNEEECEDECGTSEPCSGIAMVKLWFCVFTVTVEKVVLHGFVAWFSRRCVSEVGES